MQTVQLIKYLRDIRCWQDQKPGTMCFISFLEENPEVNGRSECGGYWVSRNTAPITANHVKPSYTMTPGEYLRIVDEKNNPTVWADYFSEYKIEDWIDCYETVG